MTRLNPSSVRAGLLDATAALVLTLVLLTTFEGTFDGWAYLAIAAVGAVGGLAVATLVERMGWPAYAGLPVAIVALLLLAPPVALRESPVPPWPGPGSARVIGHLLVGGWRELLTTLPPVSALGPMTVLPFTLAMVGAGAALILARRSSAPFLPVLPPAAVGALAILLGVASPAQTLGRAVAALALAVAWGMIRRRRRIESSPGGAAHRAVTATALIGVAAAAALAVSPALADAVGGRTVFRAHVVAPVDVADQPSPLASFRRFRPVARDLADSPLFTVSGLPQGAVVRIATLDTYSGSVWAAGNGRGAVAATAGGSSGFLRIGSRIPATTGGAPVDATVTIAPAYAANPDLSVWVPTVGEPTSVTFSGRGAADRHAALRYNPATSAGLLTSRLRAGDSYRLTAVLAPAAVPTLGQPGSVTTPNTLTSVTSKLVASTPAGRDRLAQVVAIADRLRRDGAYSDGAAGSEGESGPSASTEATIVPGHSLGRLRAFLAEPEPAGNDEQFAATLALAAEYVGLPARVVLGAVPDATGVVRGSAVRAWVEVQADQGRWVSFAPETFVPPYDKKPKPRSTVEEDRTHAAIVPPPNAQRPPGSLDGFALDESTSGRQRDKVEQTSWVLPQWAVVALKVVSVPVGTLLGWTLLLVGVKSVRRATRRRRGDADARIGWAWRDVVDTLRDSGHAVSIDFTRAEVAELVGGSAVADAAGYADRLAYGPTPGTPQDAAAAWALARRVRTQSAATQSWRQRWLSAVSLRSVVPALARVGAAVRPSALQLLRVVPDGVPAVVPSEAGSSGSSIPDGSLRSARRRRP